MNREKEEPRKTGVSILMNGQALFTQPTDESDVLFFERVKQARQKWLHDGKPESGASK